MILFIKAIKEFSGTVILIYGAFFICLNLKPEISFSQIPDLKMSFSKTNTLLNLSHNPDSLKKKSPGNKKFVMKKKPWTAVAYSALLPGAGQFYNESYWKIPVVWGLGGYFAYELIRNNNSYLDYKDLYENSQTPENPDGDQSLKSLREFYRDQRDDFIIYSVILYVVNLIDAYVDAELYDFDVSDKIKVNILRRNNLLDINYFF